MKWAITIKSRHKTKTHNVEADTQVDARYLAFIQHGRLLWDPAKIISIEV